jgi:hypothetical protein
MSSFLGLLSVVAMGTWKSLLLLWKTKGASAVLKILSKQKVILVRNVSIL